MSLPFWCSHRNLSARKREVHVVIRSLKETWAVGESSGAGALAGKVPVGVTVQLGIEEASQGGKELGCERNRLRG